MSELGIHTAGDPRGRSEFAALCEELSKLNHPARPDVDWYKVEQWCRELLRESGGDLQTAAFFALALSHRRGLSGMADGMALLAQLLASGWDRLWPLRLQERTDILAWLFTQLQPLLRGLEVGERELPAARRLDAELAGVEESLGQHLQPPPVPLRALRQQVEKLAIRLERGVATISQAGRVIVRVPFGDAAPAVNQVLATSADPTAPTVVELEIAMVSAPAPATGRRGRRVLLWLLAGSVAVMLLSALWWWGWLPEWVGTPESAQVGVPGPVRLDNQLLFASGSAELKSESTKMLIKALATVKAQPGWVIVIAGHSDATGDTQQNLELSRSRAEAVRDWMQSMGDVPDDCFAVRGYGSSQPIADNETEAGRAANRRVDISLRPEKGACQASMP
ncbi:OmpA family protein [Pseudomonas sp. LFM046]|uniref:OmpA family protein n=1 Tax=Pseudomonas sp. LFM046 TaxID=1608357 RepID=UPI000699101A|nr:OmpA family protein [Pseudomonas sp. LFM046]